jgi:methyl-accepting chemotaxis protein
MAAFDNLRLPVKLALMIGVAVLCLGAVCALSLTLSYGRMRDERVGKIHAVVDMAVHLAAGLERQVQAGTLSHDEALQRFRDILAAERFEDDNYLYAYGYDLRVMALPPAPKMVGQFNPAKDDSGGSLVAAIVAHGRAGSRAPLFYHYQRPGSTDPAGKLAIVADFPPWQMVVGSGVYADDLREQIGRDTLTLALVALPLCLLLLGVGLLTNRSIVGGLARLAGDMRAVAGGERHLAISGARRRDEVGAMARTLEVFRDALGEADRLAADQLAAQQARQHRASAVEALAQRFETSAAQLVQSVSTAARAMEGTAQGMSTGADRTSAQALDVASAAEQTATNVGSVASAADALAASIQDIAGQVAQASAIAGRAVGDASATDAAVRALATNAERIGTVVKLIQAIAGQTNLLALNATIEAARAGAHGSGFAVVAGEVKTLANQTARATEDIARQIGEIRAASEQVVLAVQGIGATIGEISRIADVVAPAVAAQGAATAEIARNVQQAAARTAQVTSTIGEVKLASAATGTAARDVLGAAGRLSESAVMLSREVDRFLAEVKAA